MRPVLIIAVIAALAAPARAADGAFGRPAPAPPEAAGQPPGAEGRASGAARQVAELRVHLSEEGDLAVAGRVPEGIAPEVLREILPDVDPGGIGRAPGADPGGWEAALTALAIVLPRFRTAEARLSGGTLGLTGTLHPGFSAEGARAALRVALARGWRLEAEIAESDPPAGITVRKADDTVTLGGLLPAGLDPERAAALVGDGAVLRGVAGGGADDARAWEAALATLARALDLFFTAEGSIAEQRVRLAGVLRPGYTAEGVTAMLVAGIPEGWRALLDAGETPPSEGDRRVSLATGEPETFRRGFWLPDLDFPVSAERCAAEADAALAEGGVRFRGETAEIDPASRAVIDRLAAIAVRCLNSSPLRLEIGGHTDSAGNDRENQALSEARAGSVRRALLQRGVRPEAVSAKGHGESAPVATNDTVAGRAANERIEFDWSEESRGGMR